MNDFSREPEELIQIEIANCERVIRSGWYILGKELAEFESSWAQYSGCRFAVGLANGMDAIECGLRILGIAPGDEVITTPMTAFATVLAILRAGATPVLADVDLETGLLSLESAARCLTKKTRAIVPVHLYGRPLNLPAFHDFCTTAGIYLIEDCAQAHGAKWKNIQVGSLGHVGAWSFYPTKNLGAFGDAGALTCNSEKLADQARILRNYGQSVRYYHPVQGFNSRLDEMQAAILSARLMWLDRFTQKRQAIAQTYYSKIANENVELLRAPTNEETHVHHLFVLRSKNRETFMQQLQNDGVETLIHYPVPVHKRASCIGIKVDPNGLEHAECHAETCFSIPCHPGMTAEEVETVWRSVNAL
jgi:dTDP-4-amino-4,6-dideoxygalactose transaminase